MKLATIALIAATASASLVQEQATGIDKKSLQEDFHWKKQWPSGSVDDSTDDDLIMNWIRKPKAPKPPIRYHDKMRQWQEGTWPVYHTWDKDMEKATQHYQIDDGTDDNEVVALQLMQRTSLY